MLQIQKRQRHRRGKPERGGIACGAGLLDGEGPQEPVKRRIRLRRRLLREWLTRGWLDGLTGPFCGSSDNGSGRNEQYENEQAAARHWGCPHEANAMDP